LFYSSLKYSFSENTSFKKQLTFLKGFVRMVYSHLNIKRRQK